MSEPVYNVDYFIAKFEAIPEQFIGTVLISRHCATWHCGVRDIDTAVNHPTPELSALGALFAPFAGPVGTNAYERVFIVNDGAYGAASLGDTPRARILAALHEIKSKESK